MNTNKTISVVIPNYNYGRFIGEAIESVLAQTYQPIEIVVVDDGSTDDSVKIIESFGDKVKLIKQENGGVGKARNTGIKNSAGSYIAFLDADDVWLPKKIELQVKFFETHAEIGLVTAATREFDADRNTITEYLDGKGGWCAEDLLLFNQRVVNGPGSSSLIKREVVEQVGGFDENKQMHPSEDWEFCYRVAQKYKLGFLPEILVEYRNHGSNGHLQIPRFERAMLLAFEKIFRDSSTDIQKLKHQSYGNLHKVLAGSYFQDRQYGRSLKHLVTSIWLAPRNIFYFAKFPLRKASKNNSIVK